MSRIRPCACAQVQVYKMNLVDVRPPAGQAVDSARQNLANTFVNAFVNAGFGQDKLMTAVPNADGASSDNVHWIFKNKVHAELGCCSAML